MFHRAFRPVHVLPVLGLAVLLMACLGGAAPLDGLGALPPATVAGGPAVPVHLKAADAAAGDLFGSAVALSRDGNTLAVGADLKAVGAQGFAGLWSADRPQRAGAVYVFVRTAQGWTEQAQLTPVPSAPGSSFGFSLSLSSDGNTLAVGAPFEAVATETGEQGAVYVFDREAGRWSTPVRLAAAPGADGFGVSVALSGRGDVLAVGTPGQDGEGKPGEVVHDRGSVHVFGRDGGAWTERADLRATDPQAGGGLGASLALSIDGRTLAAGTQSTGRGAVHVFQQGTAGWSEQDVVLSGGTSAHQKFGVQLALSGDGSTLAVGARGATGSPARDAATGMAYVFARQAGRWRQQARLQASNAEAGDAFGAQLALSADGAVLAVAAVHEASAATGLNGPQDDNRTPQAGAVYLFARDAAAWRQRHYLKATNTGAGDAFGSALSLSGDGGVLAVGARLEDSGPSGDRTRRGPLQNSGAVYLHATR